MSGSCTRSGLWLGLTDLVVALLPPAAPAGCWLELLPPEAGAGVGLEVLGVGLGVGGFLGWFFDRVPVFD